MKKTTINTKVKRNGNSLVVSNARVDRLDIDKESTEQLRAKIYGTQYNSTHEAATETTEPKLEHGKRFNKSKTPYHLVPLDLLDGTARVFKHGEIKYGRGNYRKGYEDVLETTGSLLRHYTEFQKFLNDGDEATLYDKETGECHLHHLICSALISLQAMRKNGYKV